MITKELLLSAAKAKGLSNREYIEKDYFQDLLLYNICKRTNMLAFKGGTALYKLYSLPRFSEDLDFSMLGKPDPKAAIEAAVEASGGGIKSVKKTKGSMLIKAGFGGIITRYNTLRLDISTDNPVLSGFDVKSYVPGYADINPFTIRALKPAELLAEKVHALLAREKARDLYDSFFLLRFAPLDMGLIGAKLANFGMEFSHKALARRISALESLWVPELKNFVLSELPDFTAVKKFVLDKFVAVGRGKRNNA